MLNIAIVEDELVSANTLQSYLKRFEQKKEIDITTVHFESAEDFLESKQSFNLVFMDIELPGLSGMDAAFKLRKADKNIIIIFVTNTAQFAVTGYSVNALDYIVKPMNYAKLFQKMEKVLDLIEINQDVEVIISQPTGIIRLSSNEIQYIEVNGHKLYYHTRKETIQGYGGTLSELETKLKKVSFMRCKSCFLVNPKYIQTVNGLTVTMRNGDELTISQPRRKQFMSELSDWLGRGNFS